MNQDNFDRSIDSIYQDFNNSINWNAYLLIIQKFLMVLNTSLFFQKLSTIDFTIWANINSVIFLILLWIDFGFRKSFPCFIPEFSHSKYFHIRFTKFVIKFQVFALILGFITFFLSIKSIFHFLGITLNSFLIFLTLLIFLLEGIILLFRFIFHSHFWNKQFNLIYSSIIIFEAFLNIIFIFFFDLNFNRLITILLIKIITDIIIINLLLINIKKLYQNKSYFSEKTEKYFDYSLNKKLFIRHSFIIWLNILVKSLTERNFLIPAITYFINPLSANLFKISNDWALFFQRCILKTIGSSDTSLISYTKEKIQIHIVIEKIVIQILQICIPLLGIFVFIIINKDYFLLNNKNVFQIFLVLTSLYIIEALFSPLQSLLEVNKAYFILLFSSLPFFLFILLIFFKGYLIVNLWNFVFILCSVRLVNFLIILVYANKKYELKLSTTFKKIIVH